MRRFHVDDAIPEALFGARAPVVGLIRIKHDDLPGRAGPYRPPVVEYLNSPVGQADCVGVVTVLLVGLAGESGTKKLYATCWPRAGNPAPDRPPARSFKTLAA